MKNRFDRSTHQKFLTAGAWLAALVSLTVSSWAQTTPQPQTSPPPNQPAESVKTDKPETSTAAETKPATEAEIPKAPLPGPKLLNLRYDEDFSYLDGDPESYKHDFFDPIKNIHLGDDWRLNIGGEFRFQMESETNKAFGSTVIANDTFQLYRFLMHADVRYRKLFRVFVQGIEAFDEQRDLLPRVTDENQWDLQQLFFELRILGEDVPLTLRLGRQELNYGNQRLVSPAEWTNVRRRFDGVKIFYKSEKWDADFFYVKPIPTRGVHFDDYDEQFDFYGIHTTFKGIPRHGIDAYVFAVDNTNDLRNPNGRLGDKSTYTLGSRFWGKTGGFDYESEAAGQWGHWAGDTVQAWMVALDGGYTLNHKTKPRFGAGFDWASGDGNPADRNIQTFDQLFPLGHKYFGFLDLVGRQNVIGPNVNFSIWPVAEKVQLATAFHHFWLSRERDALYNAGGVAVRRDLTGRSGDNLGSELDLTLSWKIDVHSSVLLGYSHFWQANFIQETGPSEDADLFYIQYAFRF